MILRIKMCPSNKSALVATGRFHKTLQSVELTIVAKEAIGFLRLDGDETSDEVVDDGSDQHDEQEDLGLWGGQSKVVH